ncbi:amino acid synthesis family protein [Nakamurella flavida]|uniref:Amino acid synthesis family protein n=1 Tax=Nakamurella flavida TaxID=363630 RepID=A0A938YQH2_9ACTN|nr:amino acid synthesis family protein [Nakamurella flavida]MBM9477368.1 amino acid synthesis family protein [Nakamurella flavida]MDP9777300.1 hypothetical protein [Nakamurella flavida]
MLIRKTVTMVEETLREGGVSVDPPARVAVVAVVVANPWAGRGHVADLGPVADEIAPAIGAHLAPLVIAALGAPAEAYGKAAIVGTSGEIEHGSALIHTLAFGNHLREPLAALTLLPAVEKRAAAGTTFDIPLKHVMDATIRSHHQSIEMRIPDAPGPDEIVVALALAAQGRPLQRLPAFRRA